MKKIKLVLRKTNATCILCNHYWVTSTVASFYGFLVCPKCKTPTGEQGKERPMKLKAK